MQLEGKRVLITGAGSGIGRALAIAAAQRGMTVALCGRRASALSETAAMMGSGNRHILLAGDLTRSVLRRELAEFLTRNWNGLDLLVNNAGVVHAGPLALTSDDDVTRIMTTNVIAPAALTRELLPLLSKSAPSRIVNVGSMFGDIPYPLFSIYSASKCALRGLSVALRREFKPLGIAVTYAAPRATRTDAARAFHPLTKALQMRLDEPQTVAAHIWRAVERDDDTAYACGPERLFMFVERLFPALVDRAVTRQMADIRVRGYIEGLYRCARYRSSPLRCGGVQPETAAAPACATTVRGQNSYSFTQDVCEEQDDAN